MPTKKTRVLWVDDDNDDEGLLAGLLLFFRAAGVEPIRSHGFEDARQKLWNLTSAGDASEPLNLLSDIILPQSLGMGALAWDLGVRLAVEAVDRGVQRIAFLTVVEEDEARDRIRSLARSEFEWRLFSKPMLFDGDTIERLVSYLTGIDTQHDQPK